jgi:Protein of unknown function (DUF3830)
MPRHLRISLASRRVSCRARLLDEEAPRTAASVWSRLPLEAPAWHTKTSYAEIYALFHAEQTLPLENPVFAPAAGDIVHFSFARSSFPANDPRTRAFAADARLSCVASFYERHSIHRIESGIVPGSRFAIVVSNLDEWRRACYSLLREGNLREQLRIERG